MRCSPNKFPIILKIISLLTILFTGSISVFAQHEKVKVDSTFNQLFTRSGDGFTGGDGTYSILLPDGRTVWIFGDTFLGTVNPDGTRKKMDPLYVRNSFVVQDGYKMTTYYTGTPENYSSLIIPPEVLEPGGAVTEDSVWYWPGDAFIENGVLKVFVSKFIKTGEGMWGFAWNGTAIASFSLPELKQTGLFVIPETKLNGIHFGHSILEGDSYTYIYGLKEGKPYGARAIKGEVEQEWEYYSDGRWVANSTESTPVADINGSEQFSVIQLNNTYYLITQLAGLSNEIWAFHSDNPFNWTFSRGKKIYTIELPFDNPNLFTYNALAHPQFIDQKNRILISYNTNSHRLQDHFDNAHIYKPRFIRIPVHALE